MSFRVLRFLLSAVLVSGLASAAHAAPATGSADARFRKLGDEWIDGWLARKPATATRLGIHKDDAKLPAVTQASLAEETTWYHHLRDELHAIPRAQLYREMADTAATLYVTLSECSPMLPLESFALGVPCLVGPSSHLFRDDPWLAPRLVVEDPLNSALIARKLDRVIAERESVIAHYRDYARSELAQAKRGIESLIA